MAIRFIRLFTGDDGQSHFAAGEIEWDRLDALNAVSRAPNRRVTARRW